MCTRLAILGWMVFSLHVVCIGKSLDNTGGIFEVPSKGCVAIIDCRGEKATDEFKEQIKQLEKFTRVRFVQEIYDDFILSSTPKDAMRKAKAQVAVFIVDDKSLPISLHAIESNWGMINLAQIQVASSNKEIFISRAKKMFMRVAVLALGAWRSDGHGSFLINYSNLKDLDKLKGHGMTLFELSRIMNHLLDLGITRSYSVTYYDLCRQGKAPAPTNDIQKAIWNKVRSVPKNPMKIEFDPKKGR